MSKDNIHNSPASELADAVQHQNVETSLRLLKAAGGACQAQDLAAAAKQIADKNWIGEAFAFSVAADLTSGKETLTLYDIYGHSVIPVAGVTQDACKK